MRRVLYVLPAMLLLVTSSDVRAAEPDRVVEVGALAAAAGASGSNVPAETRLARAITVPPVPSIARQRDRVRAERPAALLPLYVTFAALQVLDAHSTLRATSGGAAERNPFVQPVAAHPGAMIALKAATAGATITLTERLWRRHRAAAIALMIGTNIGYAAIVASNYRAAR
jgi:hypothetical protein